LEDTNERLNKEIGSLLQRNEKLTNELNTTKDQLREAFTRIVDLTQLTQKISEEKVALIEKFNDPKLRREIALKEREMSEMKEAK
jgi:formiminotetrahydrofolate cyclodeaminase